jgi:hypothetical protein
MATKTAIRDLNESSLSRASGAMPVQEVKTEPVSNHLLDDQGGHWTQVYHPNNQQCLAGDRGKSRPLAKTARRTGHPIREEL